MVVVAAAEDASVGRAARRASGRRMGKSLWKSWRKNTLRPTVCDAISKGGLQVNWRREKSRKVRAF